MNSAIRLLLIFAISGTAAISGFSQQTKTNDGSSREGLRKISGPTRDVELNIDIDEIAIEKSIEEALKSAEAALKNLDIHIDPIQIDLKDMMSNLEPIIVDIPEINVDIEPIDIDLDELDIDIDLDKDLDFIGVDKDLKDKADEDRNKGLKKIN